MLKEFEFDEIIVEEELEIGNIKLDAKEVYPALDDLEVTPTGEEQNFKSNSYGYGNVKVKGIVLQNKEVIPSEEEQVIKADTNYSGLNEVKVNAISSEYVKPTGTLDITTNEIHDVKNYEKVNVDVHEPAPYAPRAISFNAYRGTDLDYEISNLDTSNMTTFAGLFNNCTRLMSVDLSKFNTSNITSLSNLCYRNDQLTNIDLSNWNTSKVTAINDMLNDCRKLTELNLNHFDVSNVENATRAFYGCQGLVTLDIGNWSMDSLTAAQYTIHNCSKLQNLKFPKNWGKAFTRATTNYNSYTVSLNYSSSLTHDSLMSVINNIYDLNLSYNVAGGGTLYTQSLQIGATNTAKLTAEEINVAVQKGWSVS